MLDKLKLLASIYSYVVFVILVFIVVVVLMLLLVLEVLLLTIFSKVYPFGFQSKLWLRLLKSVESRVFAGNGGGRISSSEVESVVSMEMQ